MEIKFYLIMIYKIKWLIFYPFWSNFIIPIMITILFDQIVFDNDIQNKVTDFFYRFDYGRQDKIKYEKFYFTLNMCYCQICIF